jgi:hypothetical protein
MTWRRVTDRSRRIIEVDAGGVGGARAAAGSFGVHLF